jgi:hypothetical protein
MNLLYACGKNDAKRNGVFERLSGKLCGQNKMDGVFQIYFFEEDL